MMKMMMMREKTHHSNPTVDVPPWSPFDDPTVGLSPSFSSAEASALAATLRRCCVASSDEDSDDSSSADALVDAFSGDEFRMYEFKVRRCNRSRSHDWTECPFAHPGEKARRRDPRKCHYSGVPCPDFRKGSCKRGDACEFAHGVFECWLHPSRYRTQPCKDGTACRRRVCFFAHTAEQLRLVAGQSCCPKSPAAVESYDGSPMRQQGMEAYFKAFMASSSSPPGSPPSESPPLSPMRRGSWPARSSANEIVRSLREWQLLKAKSTSPMSGGSLLAAGNGVFGSPRSAGPSPAAVAALKHGFFSLPSTPTKPSGSEAGGVSGGWFEGFEETEPAGRVESGRALRAMMFERLSRDGAGVAESPAPEMMPAATPDVAWISDLVM